MTRLVLIVSTLMASWWGMQGVHELGHVLGAWLTGGHVSRVVLHPLSLSRTDLSHNPVPLVVVWAGPVMGCMIPLAIWGWAAWSRSSVAFVLRFWAGFCLVANGAYLAFGALGKIGDCGVLREQGVPVWALWMFGAVTMPVGLCCWHRQGKHFGWGQEAVAVDPRVAYSCLIIACACAALGYSLETQ